jgi:hypothetical protein
LWNVESYALNHPKDQKRAKSFNENVKKENKEEQEVGKSFAKYIRYENKIAIGVKGSYDEIKKMKEEIKKYLNNTLELNLEKIKITQGTKKLTYLGYKIEENQTEKNPKKKIKGGAQSNKRKLTLLQDEVSKPIVGESMPMFHKPSLVPLGPLIGKEEHEERSPEKAPKGDQKEIIKELNKIGYCNKNGEPKPCMKFMHKTQEEINKIANKKIKELEDYYKIAKNKRSIIKRVKYIIKHSVAKLYAAKYKLKTRAQVFKIAGKNLNKPLVAKKRGVAELQTRLKEAEKKKKKT